MIGRAIIASAMNQTGRATRDRILDTGLNLTSFSRGEGNLVGVMIHQATLQITPEILNLIAE